MPAAVWVRVTFFAWDTHTHTHAKQKAVWANVASGQGALRKKGREHISLIGWRLFPQQAAAAERV